MSHKEQVDRTDAAVVVGEQMRGRLDDLGALIAIAERPEIADEMSDDAVKALGIAFADYGDAEDEARERLNEYPLCVEATTTFEIVLGTGGPDDRLLIECVGVDDHAGRATLDSCRFEIGRVLYRYSWEGTAEIELAGEDREVAERFARQVVPELVE